MNVIYQPRTRAKEYADLAVNIYQGCSNGCWYCYSKRMFNRFRPNEDFQDVVPRHGIVEAVQKQLSNGNYKGKKILLCFTCDPYPAFVNTQPTRDVIKAIKNSGAHVQILTKGGNRASRDFDLLDLNDSFGVTLTCLTSEVAKVEEPFAAPPKERILSLIEASKSGIGTWVSFEPVIAAAGVLKLIEKIPEVVSKDTFLKIGKLNHARSDIDWNKFGHAAEEICLSKGWNYYIKEDLRNDMKIV